MKPVSRFAPLLAASLLCAAPVLAQTPPATAPAASTSTIEPGAVEALKRMSAYLGTLTSFEIKADAAFDLVLDDGQKVQMLDRAVYKVRRPSGFVIERTSDYKDRRFYYDGKKLTVYSPRSAYYAQVDAPPTIRQTLDAVSERYGIELPLTDLFRWSEPDGGRADQLKEAFYVGPSTIGGVTTDQYAFREADVDWQIWISRGDAPVPRRVTIVDRSNPTQPQYTANLNWTLNPTFAPATFAFQPPKDALPIKLTAIGK
jgi:hypothetical protein